MVLIVFSDGGLQVFLPGDVTGDGSRYSLLLGGPNGHDGAGAL